MNMSHFISQERTKQLIRFFRSKGLGREDAKDCTQETLLRVYKSREKYNPSKCSNPDSWLFAIASNVFITFRDKNIKRKEVPLAQVNKDCIAKNLSEKSEPTPMENLSMKESIDKCLSKLSSQEQSIVCLRSIGVCYQEIAEILGISINNAKVCFHRIKTKLKKLTEESL